MKPTYEQLVDIVDSLQERVKKLEKENEKLRNELRKYINENTPSGDIPQYLKKLEKEVDKYAKDENPEPPKANKRNARPRQIDRKEHHSLKNPVCPKCGSNARRRGTSTRKRIVIELQLPKAETVEHECDVYQCKKCSTVFAAPVLNALPNTKFDITVMVLMSYLFNAAKMSVGDIKSLLHLFGVDASKGNITDSMKRLKLYLGEYYGELLERIKSSPTRYKDETTHRFNGKNFWVWVIATTDWVYYKIEDSRSYKVARELGSTSGVDVVDGYAGYNKLESDIQRDWSHMLRRAKKPIHDFGRDEKYTGYKKWAKRLAKLFHDAKVAKKKSGPSEALRREFDERLWKLVKSAPKEGRNFARIVNYIMKFDGEWFTFLQHKDTEPTSNRAERALRPMVIKRRISQQSRGEDNLDSYAMQMSLYMTSKLQGQDYFENLSNILKNGVSSSPYKS